MPKHTETRNGTCSYNLVYNFLIYLFPLQISVFVVHFPNAIWHDNETFQKVSSKNEIVPLLLIFHLLQSYYRGAKICFDLCCYQNQNFLLVSNWCRKVCRSLLTRVAVVSLVSHFYCTRVAPFALVSLVSGTGVVKQTRF